ncbi:alpha-amylase [Exiguobacterium sp. TRN 1102]|uniref:alpha-amylase n=1 Tax=Exiguobacterium sp. TRN 1102 TaxID=3420732 RepID=UPI003D770216
MSENSTLHKLCQVLRNKRTNFTYEIPSLWNRMRFHSEPVRDGVERVNPYDFLLETIEKTIFPYAHESRDYHTSIALADGHLQTGGDWIKRASVYSMQVRTSTSWDHDGSGYVERENSVGMKDTGTFVKALAMIPHLLYMGIDTLFLLPISQHSYKNKKGEFGSPYAVQDFFAIDEELKETLTGDEMTVEEEFAAFVEACHMVGIRVVIDVIPRTCARDNRLILENPEWFYWIPLTEVDYYHPPYVPGIGENVKPEFAFLPMVYNSEDVWQHLRRFSMAPNLIDAEKWDRVRNTLLEHPEENVLAMIEREFGLTTAPAFSDCINDPQPPWSDVTYFRLFLDHPLAAAPYVNDANIAPYILFDSIKSNQFRGNEINEPLWEMLADIIPHYQREYGIDGARIDMGHALPVDLAQRILEQPRAIDSNFSFIAEELIESGAWAAKDAGYNMIIGYGFYKEPRFNTHETHQFLYDSRFLPLPVFAAGETADTRRLATREGGRKASRLLTVLNGFMPNGVPMTNSGLELYETQPMNTGLDCRLEEAYQLFPTDPYFGKLAFFDAYQFHWDHPERDEMIEVMHQVAEIRRRWLDVLVDPNHFEPLILNEPFAPFIGFAWLRPETNDTLLVVANTNMVDALRGVVTLDGVRRRNWNASCFAEMVYSPDSWPYAEHSFDDNWNLVVDLKPGEVKVYEMR